MACNVLVGAEMKDQVEVLQQQQSEIA